MDRDHQCPRAENQSGCVQHVSAASASIHYANATYTNMDDVSDLLEPKSQVQQHDGGDGVLTQSDRTEAFCQTYAATFSLKKASEAGGYLTQEGWKMLRRPNIAARVLELAHSNGLNVNPAEVITHLKAVGFATPLDIIDPLVLESAGFYNLTPELQMCVQALEYEIDHYELDLITGQRRPVLSKVKIKWYDKLKALDMLSRILELLKDSLAITDPDGTPLGTGARLSEKDLDIRLQKFFARVAQRIEDDDTRGISDGRQ